MSDKVLTPTVVKGYYPAAMLELDIDPSAHRFMVIDRSNGSLLRHGYKPSHTNVKKMFFQPTITTNPNLAVILLDDTRNFNAVIADGVKLQLVDINQVDE